MLSSTTSADRFLLLLRIPNLAESVADAGAAAFPATFLADAVAARASTPERSHCQLAKRATNLPKPFWEKSPSRAKASSLILLVSLPPKVSILLSADGRRHFPSWD